MLAVLPSQRQTFSGRSTKAERSDGRYTVHMMSEPSGSSSFDSDDALRVIDEADVVVVGFAWLSDRLLVDARRSASAGPYVRVVTPVRTPQERIRQLRELRPGFNDPDSFVFLPWSGRVDSFVQAGLYDRILGRCADDESALSDCRTALEKLEQLDRADLRQAIRGGEKYHTLYEYSPAD